MNWPVNLIAAFPTADAAGRMERAKSAPATAMTSANNTPRRTWSGMAGSGSSRPMTTGTGEGRRVSVRVVLTGSGRGYRAVPPTAQTVGGRTLPPVKGPTPSGARRSEAR